MIHRAKTKAMSVHQINTHEVSVNIKVYLTDTHGGQPGVKNVN